MPLLECRGVKKLVLSLIWLLSWTHVSGFAQQTPLRDPTRPGQVNSPDAGVLSDNQTAGQGPDINLSGIVIRPDSRVAILNGERVAQGDVWQGYTLSQVEYHSVVLKNDQSEWNIRLSNSIDIKTVRNNEL